MCSRFALFRWSREFAAIPGFPPGQQPRWNIAPKQQVLIEYLDDAGNRVLGQALWGLAPAWLKNFSTTPAQARLETLNSQPMFREAFQSRRCLIPINGFYEWRGNQFKRPFWISSEDKLLYMAALREVYPVGDEVFLSTAVITRAAAQQRRPVLLDPLAQQLWLDPASQSEQLLAMLEEARMPLRERALAPFINDPTLDAPECLTPA